MPQTEGKIEGGEFALQWICHMLQVDIQLWFLQRQSLKKNSIVVINHQSCSS